MPDTPATVSSPNGSSDLDLSGARALVFNFVAGEEVPAATLRVAIDIVVRADRAFLERLEASALGSVNEPAASECAVTLAGLPEYLEGRLSGAELPYESRAHLQVCEHCRKALVLAEAAAACEALWLEFSRRLEPGRLHPLLVLLRSGWHWLTTARSSPEPLGRRSAPAAQEFGGFEFGGTVAPQLALASAAPPVQLVRALPSDGIRVELLLRPDAAGGERGAWVLHLRLLPGAGVSAVGVGIGSKQAHDTGLRALRPGHDVEFTLSPPPSRAQPAWLHFEWQAAGGPVRSFQTMLPLVKESAS